MSLTADPRMCLSFLTCIFTLFLSLSFPTSFPLAEERKRPGGKEGAGRERGEFPDVLVVPAHPSASVVA